MTYLLLRHDGNAGLFVCWDLGLDGGGWQGVSLTIETPGCGGCGAPWSDRPDARQSHTA